METKTGIDKNEVITLHLTKLFQIWNTHIFFNAKEFSYIATPTNTAKQQYFLNDMREMIASSVYNELNSW